MARKRFDEDFDGDQCGVVGGELTSCDYAGCDGYDFDPGPLVNISDRLTSGDEHAYLGHFRQPRYAAKGHNDVDATGKIDNADDQNAYVGATEQGVAPGSSGSQVGQFAAISGAGNPL